VTLRPRIMTAARGTSLPKDWLAYSKTHTPAQQDPPTVGSMQAEPHQRRIDIGRKSWIRKLAGWASNAEQINHTKGRFNACRGVTGTTSKIEDCTPRALGYGQVSARQVLSNWRPNQGSARPNRWSTSPRHPARRSATRAPRRGRPPRRVRMPDGGPMSIKVLRGIAT